MSEYRRYTDGYPDRIEMFARGIRATPAFILFPIVFCVAMFTYLGFIHPMIYRRSWQIPAHTALLWQRGIVSGGRITSSGPYTLTAAGGAEIKLYCDPYIEKYNNCLDRAGINTRGPDEGGIYIGYFTANTVNGIKNIIMEVKSDKTDYIRYESSLQSLNQTQNQEDSDESFPIVNVAMTALLVSLISTCLYVKISQIVRRKSTQ